MQPNLMAVLHSNANSQITFTGRINIMTVWNISYMKTSENLSECSKS